MSEAEHTEATRQALVAAARERLSAHLHLEDAVLAPDDPAREALTRLTAQLREAGR